MAIALKKKNAHMHRAYNVKSSVFWLKNENKWWNYPEDKVQAVKKQIQANPKAKIFPSRLRGDEV